MNSASGVSFRSQNSATARAPFGCPFGHEILYRGASGDF
jgi:hypothetical protein